MQHADWDGTLLHTWKVEQGHLVRRQHQPSQDAILDLNAELRRNPGALENMSFMGLELQIPEVDYHRLVAEFPALASKDVKERTATWRMLMKTDVLDPYRVRDRKRARARGL